MTSEEIWKDIPGYEGRYQASTLGRVRSVSRILACGKGGKSTRLMHGRVLRPASSKTDPHLYVVLGHKAAGSTVHSLIARTFLGPCPQGEEIRHLDGDAKNNAVENLAYGTRRENILDVARIGKPWRKLTAEQAKEIYRRVQAGEKGRTLAEEYGVKESAVSAIKKGRTFGWATGQSVSLI